MNRHVDTQRGEERFVTTRRAVTKIFDEVPSKSGFLNLMQ